MAQRGPRSNGWLYRPDFEDLRDFLTRRSALMGERRVSYHSPMSRLGVFLGVMSTGLLLSTSAGAQVYRLSEGDGTVHFTNAPTDLRYKNLAGYSSGTCLLYTSPSPRDS